MTYSSADRERRQYARFPQVLEVHARSLLSDQTEEELPKEFDGRIHDLSNGGVSILSSYPLQPSTFVCCDVPVFDAPVSVPTLLQVRWTAEHGDRPMSYISGLQFVLVSSYAPPLAILSEGNQLRPAEELPNPPKSQTLPLTPLL